jgi:hypothetical protein
LRKLLPRRAEAFEAGPRREGEDPLGDNIGLVQSCKCRPVMVAVGQPRATSNGPIFGISVADGEVGAGVAIPVHRRTAPGSASSHVMRHHR